MLMKPDLMFLSLGITTFYRKSFTFESQVSVCNCPAQYNPVFIPGIPHTVLFSWMCLLEAGPVLLPGPPPAGAGSGVSGGRREGQEL